MAGPRKITDEDRKRAEQARQELGKSGLTDKVKLQSTGKPAPNDDGWPPDGWKSNVGHPNSVSS